MTKQILFLFTIFIACIPSKHMQAQEQEKYTADSLYIEYVEERQSPHKILHAEPLYIDLIRDLGARKGEKEWNLGLGITDNLRYDTYQALVEYEFAPVDRLGLEIEVPFTFYSPLNGTDPAGVPSNRMESLKTAVQWTFLVSPRTNISMALGYINELEFPDLKRFGEQQTIQGNLFNPFFVAAKRWGNNFHSLIYTGPKYLYHLREQHWDRQFDLNTNLHYMIPGTRNFVGVEVNKEFRNGDFDMVIRPQLRLGITEHLLIGILAGIPVDRENQRFSTFARLIWEP